MKTFVVAVCLLILMTFPVASTAGGSEVTDSSYWARLAHQENSIVASVLYIPYLILQFPVKTIDGLIYPKPASQATIPPAAHRIP
jgi:hypothetical protein